MTLNRGRGRVMKARLVADKAYTAARKLRDELLEAKTVCKARDERKWVEAHGLVNGALHDIGIAIEKLGTAVTRLE